MKMGYFGESQIPVEMVKKILGNLFWEYDLDSVANNLTSPFVIARVLELGNPEQFRLLADLIGDEAIKEFLREKGKKLLSPRSYNFWVHYYSLNETAPSP